MSDVPEVPYQKIQAEENKVMLEVEFLRDELINGVQYLKGAMASFPKNWVDEHGTHVLVKGDAATLAKAAVAKLDAALKEFDALPEEVRIAAVKLKQAQIPPAPKAPEPEAPKS